MPRSQHNCSAVKKLFSELTRLGFQVKRNKSGCIRITPPGEQRGAPYFTHGTIKCIEPLKRDIKRLYNIDVSEL